MVFVVNVTGFTKQINRKLKVLDKDKIALWAYKLHWTYKIMTRRIFDKIICEFHYFFKMNHLKNFPSNRNNKIMLKLFLYLILYTLGKLVQHCKN